MLNIEQCWRRPIFESTENKVIRIVERCCRFDRYFFVPLVRSTGVDNAFISFEFVRYTSIAIHLFNFLYSSILSIFLLFVQSISYSLIGERAHKLRSSHNAHCSVFTLHASNRSQSCCVRISREIIIIKEIMAHSISQSRSGTLAYGVGESCYACNANK